MFMGAALHRAVTGLRGRLIDAALWSWTRIARMALSTDYSFLVRNASAVCARVQPAWSQFGTAFVCLS